MGVEVWIDVEGTDPDQLEWFEHKLLADIVTDATDSDETLTKKLAKKHGFDLDPLTRVSDEEEIMEGPWQDPRQLWGALYGLHQSILKEGDGLLGQEIGYRELDSEEIEFYMEIISVAVGICKRAAENEKRVRLTIG